MIDKLLHGMHDWCRLVPSHSEPGEQSARSPFVAVGAYPRSPACTKEMEIGEIHLRGVLGYVGTLYVADATPLLAFNGTFVGCFLLFVFSYASLRFPVLWECVTS